MEKRGDINPRYTPDLSREHPAVAVEDAKVFAELERLEKQGVAAEAQRALAGKLRKSKSE